MDNNALACDHGLEQIEQMGYEKVWVDFNQGFSFTCHFGLLFRDRYTPPMYMICERA